MKKTNWQRKYFLVFAVAIVAVGFSLTGDLYGQVAPSPGQSSDPVSAPEEIKQALPEPGNVTVNFKDVDIKNVLHFLSEVSGVDIIPSPGVDADVTMRLRDKPWQVALDIVARNYGYVYSREEDIIRIMPRSQLHTEEPVTEVIPLNHLIREIELTRESTGDETVTAEEKKESIDQLMEAIDSIIDVGKGENATFITSANAIIITAIPARISNIKKMVKLIDKKTPQIMLTAKIIKIQLTKDERFGVNWNAIITASGASRPTTFPFSNDGMLGFLPNSEDQSRFYPTATSGSDNAAFPLSDIAAITANTAGDLFTMGTLDFSSFSATLSLLQNRTDTEVLSSPRITTLNNQKATIKVVDKIMLQKSQETTATQTSGVVTVEFETEDEAREVGVKLTVIPHVNEEGDISVNLLPEVSTNSGFTELSIDDTTNTLALTFNSREANTVVRVKDGETIFIGGLIKETITKTDNKFPILGDLLGDIPLLGNLFKYEADAVTKSEIVFFVTVNIVKDVMDTITHSNSMSTYNEYVTKRQIENFKNKDESETVPIKKATAGVVKGKKKGNLFKNFVKKK